MDQPLSIKIDGPKGKKIQTKSDMRENGCPTTNRPQDMQIELLGSQIVFPTRKMLHI